MEHFDHPSPPHFNDAKMAGFVLRAPSSLLWGGRGLIVPFYSVQDCSYNRTDALNTDVHLFFTITTGQNDQA